MAASVPNPVSKRFQEAVRDWIAEHASAADPHTGYQKESEKGAASGYASLGSDVKVPVAQLPAIGWHLNKNGSDQLNLGTAVELVTWTDAHADAFADGVTFTNADDSITILSAGLYLVVLQIKWLSGTVGDVDRLDYEIRVNGTAERFGVYRTSGTFGQTYILVVVVKLAVNDVLTCYAANGTITTSDIEGTAGETFFSGALLV